MKILSAIFLALTIAFSFVPFSACGDKPETDGGQTPPAGEDEYFVEELRLTSPPIKTVYYPGEEIDLAGITVEAVWNDGVEEILSTFELEIMPDIYADIGDDRVTLMFEGASVSYDIEVKDVAVEGISVNVPKRINARVACNTLNSFSGVEVNAAYSDGEIREIAGYTTTMNGEHVEISSLSFTTPGSKTLNVEFAGKTAQFTIEAFEGFIIEAENIVASDKVTKYDRNFVEKVSGGFYAFSNENEPASSGAYMGSVFKGAVMRFHIYSEVDCFADIVLRASSSYMTEDGGSWSPIETGDQQINRMFAVSYRSAAQVEFEPVNIDKNSVLKGGRTENPQGDPLLYVNWESVKIALVHLEKGDNIIEFTAITDYVNCRGQEVACNIDRMEIEYRTGKGGAV